MRPQVTGVVSLLAVAIAIFIFAGDSTSGKAVGMAFLGVAGVVAISLVFLAIGKSEDEERAAAKRPKEPPEPPVDPHAGEAARRSRPRPPRRPT
jgi:hypothetical protein